MSSATTVDALTAATNAIRSEEKRILAGLKWTRPDYTSLLAGVETTADAFLNGLLETSPTNDRLEDLTKIVGERRAKLPLETGVTDQIIGICQQILAFGAAGIALTAGFLDRIRTLSVPTQKVLSVFGIFYLELVCISLLVLIIYMLQARFRYPFLYLNKIGNTWPWYYYSSISADVSRRPVQLARARIHASSEYAADLMNFTKKCLDESPRTRLRAEIQQYFLLMVFQGYVNQFSLRLANTFFYGFVGALTTAIVLSGLLFFGVIA